MKPTLLVLAAGIGSRYGGIKQLDKVGPSGECIIDYSIYDAIQAGFGKVVFVINRRIADEFRNFMEGRLQGRISTEYVFQEMEDVPQGTFIHPQRQKPWGTGHAVLAARQAMHLPFAAINADDFYGRTAFRLVADFFQNHSPESMNFCMVGYRLGNTLSEHGSVSRGVCHVDPQDHLLDVVEQTAIQRQADGIGFTDGKGQWTLLPEDTYVSMNFWGFTPAYFHPLQSRFEVFLRENAFNPKAEYFIPISVGHLVRTKEAVVQVLKTEDSWFGVTYREDKPETVRRIRQLVEKGVYPASLWA